MHIKIVWKGDNLPNAHEVTGRASAAGDLGLVPSCNVHLEQTLSFEAPGLNYQKPGQLVLSWKIKDVLRVLRNLGIEHPEVLLDGMSVLDYATKQEDRVTFLQIHVARAIEALRQTRSWFKDHRFAEIRQNLEKAAKAISKE